MSSSFFPHSVHPQSHWCHRCHPQASCVQGLRGRAPSHQLSLTFHYPGLSHARSQPIAGRGVVTLRPIRSAAAAAALVPRGAGSVGAMDAVSARGVAWVPGGQQTGSADSEFALLPPMLASTPLATSRRLFQTRWWFRPHPFPLKFVSTPLCCKN